MLAVSSAVAWLLIHRLPRIDFSTTTCTPGSSTDKLGLPRYAGWTVPLEFRAQPGTKVQCVSSTWLSWFVPPAGTCSNAGGRAALVVVGEAGDGVGEGDEAEPDGDGVGEGGDPEAGGDAAAVA